MAGYATQRGAIAVEDTLNDLLALIRFGLYQAENADREEFARMRDEWCTMMYIMQDKAKAAQQTAGALTIGERQPNQRSAAH